MVPPGPYDWFRIDYTDPNTGFRAGWHQDEGHPNLGRAHFQYAAVDVEHRWGVTFRHDTPPLVLWEIVEDLPRNGPTRLPIYGRGIVTPSRA